jgi:hypothetical protein
VDFERNGARMIRRILRNLSLFRIRIKHLLFAIFRMFSYTLVPSSTQTKDLHFRHGGQPGRKTLHSKLRTIANDSRRGVFQRPNSPFRERGEFQLAESCADPGAVPKTLLLTASQTHETARRAKVVSGVRESLVSGTPT